MDQEAAAAEARRLNKELGDQGATDAFYVEVEGAPGEWTVEKRRPEPERRSWGDRIIDNVVDFFTGR
jgi:hypothetical protein